MRNTLLSRAVLRLGSVIDLRAFACGICVLAVTSCTNESTSAPATPQFSVFVQVDRVGKPGVKEIFQNFDDHDTTNRSSPTNEVSLGTSIQAFAMATAPAGIGANRSLSTATSIMSTLLPDELQAQLGAGPTAHYLALELGQAGFGGRSLIDDVMNTNLGLVYGSTLSSIGVSPCFATDNVPGANTSHGLISTAAIAALDNETAQFPYVGIPH